MSKSQLKKKLNNILESSQAKRNINGKEGINKGNYYKHFLNTPRKRYFKCGN